MAKIVVDMCSHLSGLEVDFPTMPALLEEEVHAALTVSAMMQSMAAGHARGVYNPYYGFFNHTSEAQSVRRQGDGPFKPTVLSPRPTYQVALQSRYPPPSHHHLRPRCTCTCTCLSPGL